MTARLLLNQGSTRGHRPRLQKTQAVAGLFCARPVRGFTLIEVLVAMTIMAMAFSVLFSLSSRSLDGMRRARDMERRVEFARTRLAELRLIDSIAVGERAGGSLEDGTGWQVEVLPFIE